MDYHNLKIKLLRNCCLLCFAGAIFLYDLTIYLSSSIQIGDLQNSGCEQVFVLPDNHPVSNNGNIGAHPRVLYSRKIHGKLFEIWQFAPFPQKININKANTELLKLLPGVGEVRANQITDQRARNGGFRDLNDLEQIPGFDSWVLHKIAQFIQF